MEDAQGSARKAMLVWEVHGNRKGVLEWKGDAAWACVREGIPSGLWDAHGDGLGEGTQVRKTYPRLLQPSLHASPLTFWIAKHPKHDPVIVGVLEEPEF